MSSIGLNIKNKNEKRWIWVLGCVEMSSVLTDQKSIPILNTTACSASLPIIYMGVNIFFKMSSLRLSNLKIWATLGYVKRPKFWISFWNPLHEAVKLEFGSKSYKLHTVIWLYCYWFNELFSELQNTVLWEKKWWKHPYSLFLSLTQNWQIHLILFLIWFVF